MIEKLHENNSAPNPYVSMRRVFKGFVEYNDLSRNSKYASTHMRPEETLKYRHDESLVSTKQELTPTEDYPKDDDPKPSSSRNGPEIKNQDAQTQGEVKVINAFKCFVQLLWLNYKLTILSKSHEFPSLMLGPEG